MKARQPLALIAFLQWLLTMKMNQDIDLLALSSSRLVYCSGREEHLKSAGSIFNADTVRPKETRNQISSALA